MLIRTRLFARHRELLGDDELVLDLPVGSTVGDLLARIGGDGGPLAPLAQQSAVAVNLRYADESELLKEGDEVALIPPVSGG